jgi:octaprenyl-diphosphate synthase
MPAQPFPDMAEDLALVRDRIGEVTRHHGPWASQLAGTFVSNLGQMLRPGLVLAASRLDAPATPAAARDLAALVELVHAASLLHDDVIDTAETRRGRPALHRLHGEVEAVLTGDLLLAHGLRLVAPHASPGILATLARITRDLARGQLLELNVEGQPDIPVATYLDIIHRKTASFFGLSARLGGLAADLAGQELDALEAYGTSLGFAYQILDDLLDVSADQRELGKPVGADLLNRRPTLPLLRQLEREGPSGALRSALRDGREADLAPELPELVRSSGAFEAVVREAQEYCEAGRTALDRLDERPGRERMERLLGYLFERLEALTRRRGAAAA